MNLEELVKEGEPKFYILFCPSDLLFYYIEKRITSRGNIQRENTIEVNSVRKLNTTIETNKLKPLISKNWLYTLNDKVSISKEQNKLIASNTFGYYFLRVTDFRTYMRYQKVFGDNKKVVLESFSYLNYSDMKFMYEDMVENVEDSFKLNKELQKFLFRSYNGDIEKVLLLYYELRRGVKVKTQKDIIQICGVSPKTLDYYLFNLLKTPTYTPLGLKNYVKKLVQDGTELARHYGYLPLQKILVNNLKDCMDIKHMFRTNQINDSWVVDMHKGYSISKVRRYKRFHDEIKAIPLSRFTGLLKNLTKEPIYNEIDFLTFIYTYVLYKSMTQPVEVQKGIEKEKQRLLKQELRKEKNQNSDNKPKKTSKVSKKEESSFEDEDDYNYDDINSLIQTILN